jgi:hypothetical protein
MLLGVLTSSWPAEKRVDDEKTPKKTENNVSNATIGRHTRPEASTNGIQDSPGPPPLVDALGYVPVHRQGQQNGRQVWYFFVVFLWHSNPLSVRGFMARILARWRRPVASREALKPLYRSILAVTCRSIISSIETARTEVHLFVVDDHAIDLNVAN